MNRRNFLRASIAIGTATALARFAPACGPLRPGTPYLVGERGPEKLVVWTSARVYTPEELARHLLLKGKNWTNGVPS